MDQQQQQQHHAKVERFLKLGYSHSDILRVLDSLDHDAQTNNILEELIKICHTRTHGSKSVPGSPKLVPRGCSPSGSLSRAGPDQEPAAAFRPVVIDGSNVAMSHGDKKTFSCQGIQLAVNWFWDKGLRDITVFIPLWRKEPRPEALITDQYILHDLERRKILVYTPSRCVSGKRVVCYDDRYIIKLAYDSDGIIVSNDNYRDLQMENPQWKKFIEERLLMYTFANDKFMPPDDPLGRNGPTIDDFLRRKPWTPEHKLQHCPYGKKCTYGVKCKFYHPERANQSQLSVADELRVLNDRAKSFSPSPSLPDPPCRPHTHTPPPLSVEDRSHRASPSEQLICHRDTGGLRCQPLTSPHHRPSLDVDEAFSSMESSMFRLHMHDVPYSVERASRSFSSGLASHSLSQNSFSGSFGGNNQSPYLGRDSYHPHRHHHQQQQQHQNSMMTDHEGLICSKCNCVQQQPKIIPQHQHQHQHRHQAWGTCPSLLQQNREHPGCFSEKQCFSETSTRPSNSFPGDPWVQGSLSDGRLSEKAKSVSSEQRSSLRSQLSTLFPKSTVECVMNAYPHVSDMSELIALIQNNRTSYMFL